MRELTLRELAVPIIKAIDSFNFLLKSHHRHTAIISYYLGKKLNLNEDDLRDLVVSAAMHDIGALSVMERDSLLVADVVNPQPHCSMGYKMLKYFNAFDEIALVIKYHHIYYSDMQKYPKAPYICYILHLADRVDVNLSEKTRDSHEKDKILEHINSRCGTVFHPDVCEAFNEVAKSKVFWHMIHDMTLEELFEKIDFNFNVDLDMENVVEFTETLGRLVDFRSHFTFSHSYTVAHLAYYIGKIFGYPEEKCKKLQVAGYLHDIGKIGIDPGLIEKKGKLTPKEYNMIKFHTYFTEKILNELGNSDWFGEVVSWAIHHHERTDGTGYPYGISGEEFTLEMKILAYSDIISALMEERPYRNSMPSEVAFEIIKKEIAPHIDQKVFHSLYNYREALHKIIIDCQYKCKTMYESDIQE